MKFVSIINKNSWFNPMEITLEITMKSIDTIDNRYVCVYIYCMYIWAHIYINKPIYIYLIYIYILPVNDLGITSPEVLTSSPSRSPAALPWAAWASTTSRTSRSKAVRFLSKGDDASFRTQNPRNVVFKHQTCEDMLHSWSGIEWHGTEP